MGLRARLALTLGIAFVCLAVIGIVVATRVNDVRSNGRSVVQQVQPAVAAANATTLAVLDVQVDASRYALSASDADRTAITQADTRARAAYEDLASTTAADPSSAAAAGSASTAYQRWYDDVIAPSSTAIAAGDRSKARALVASPAAAAATDEVRTTLADVQKGVLQWRADSVASTSRALDVLESALTASLVVLVVLVLVLWWGLRRWVVDPLGSIAADLQRVTEGDLEHRIEVTGPPDVAATAQDAEDMRRRLLHEIDEAIAAREALDQRGPVVAALRRELRSRSSAQLPGLDTAGLLVPAEGVLAGDWYETTVLGDGRLAVLMVDVSGHGPLAGLTALKLKYSMTAALEAGAGPRGAIEAGAAVMAGEGEQFATAVVLTITSTGDVAWCNAGHPAPTILGRRSTSDRLGTTGPLLSGFGGSWTLGKARMATDTMLLVVSDGLLESRDADGVQLAEQWGDDDLLALVRDAETARGAIEAVAAAARERAANWRVDDLTLVAVRRT